mgnify:CR=1 FL=1
MLTATTDWMEATLVNIRDDAWYLVQTNGGEWRGDCIVHATHHGRFQNATEFMQKLC